MQAVALDRPAARIRVTDVLCLAVLAVNVSEYVLTWLRVLYGWLWSYLDLPPTPPLSLLEPPSPRAVIPVLLTAHLGLIVALLAARAIAYLAPRISVKNDGLLMHSAFGQRFIPDSALRALRSVELPDQHFVVWVDATRGLPLQAGLSLLLFGHWARRGFVLSSRSEAFEDAVAHVVLHLKQAYGDEKFEALFTEDKPNWLVRMLVSPLATIQEVAKAEAPLLTLREAGWQMASAACSLALPLLIAAVIHLQVPWGVLLLPIVAMGEWPLVSVYVAALSEAYARKLSFRDVLLMYPVTQLPRWVAALALSLAVIAGWPYLLYIPLFIPMIGLGGLLTVKLTEALFDIPFPNSALGMLVSVIYQAVVFGLFLALLPR